ncbi:MAG: hypothetical protein ACYC7G_07570 [Rudaea sp.]
MTTKIPAAIICETRVRDIEGGEICIKNEKFGDSFNLSTGELSRRFRIPSGDVALHAASLFC